MPDFKPLLADIRMSDYGYWIVTLGISPWQRMSVMIARVGITRAEAIDLAFTSANLSVPTRKDVR